MWRTRPEVDKTKFNRKLKVKSSKTINKKENKKRSEVYETEIENKKLNK